MAGPGMNTFFPPANNDALAGMTSGFGPPAPSDDLTGAMHSMRILNTPFTPPLSRGPTMASPFGGGLNMPPNFNNPAMQGQPAAAANWSLQGGVKRQAEIFNQTPEENPPQYNAQGQRTGGAKPMLPHFAQAAPQMRPNLPGAPIGDQSFARTMPGAMANPLRMGSSLPYGGMTRDNDPNPLSQNQQIAGRNFSATPWQPTPSLAPALPQQPPHVMNGADTLAAAQNLHNNNPALQVTVGGRPLSDPALTPGNTGKLTGDDIPMTRVLGPNAQSPGALAGQGSPSLPGYVPSGMSAQRSANIDSANARWHDAQAMKQFKYDSARHGDNVAVDRALVRGDNVPQELLNRPGLPGGQADAGMQQKQLLAALAPHAFGALKDNNQASVMELLKAMGALPEVAAAAPGGAAATKKNRGVTAGERPSLPTGGAAAQGPQKTSVTAPLAGGENETPQQTSQRLTDNQMRKKYADIKKGLGYGNSLAAANIWKQTPGSLPGTGQLEIDHDKAFAEVTKQLTAIPGIDQEKVPELAKSIVDELAQSRKEENKVRLQANSPDAPPEPWWSELIR